MVERRSSRKLIAGGVATVLAVAVVAVYFVFFACETVDGPRAPAASDRATRTSVPFYCQADARWAKHTIGGSGETIRRVGCTLCCLAMALQYRGFPVDPAELNGMLKRHRGYTSRGWLVWEAVERLTGGRYDVVVSNSPTRAAIDGQLRARNPVIAKVPSHNQGKWHWVLIVGKDKAGYVVHDPGTSRGKDNPLGERGKRIRGIRYVVLSK
jgi:hypothetical protein